MGGEQRYRQKLQLLCMCCDLYATMSEEWECNPDLWPNVEFAWAYFIAGYVTDVGLLKINSDSCLLRAKAGEFFIVAYMYIDHLSALF